MQAVDELWPAPAKLNLFLHVLGRRPDGYHELSTAFQFVNLLDWMSFSGNSSGEIALVSNMTGAVSKDNLATRAARLLRESAGITSLGVTIELQKNIPVGAGLGGGSSDAATTLVALNSVWHLGLHEEKLMELGLRIGADVPVFVRGAASWAGGVGELLIPAAFKELWFVIIHPGVSVSTQEIFSDAELTRDSEPAKITGSPLSGTRNDCERVVMRHYPEVASVIGWLKKRGPARLTGTGSCVFTWRDSKSEAMSVASRAPKGWRTYVVQGLNRSPLLQRLADEQEGR